MMLNIGVMVIGLHLSLGSVRGCVFDCQTHTYCGAGTIPKVIPEDPYATDDDSPQDDDDSPPFQFNMPTLDLSGRGITEVAVGGLSCSQFADVTALNLDHNAFVVLPDLMIFDGLGAVTLINNSIRELPVDYFNVNRSGTGSLVLTLTNNNISVIHSGTFNGFPYNNLLVQLDENVITRIEPGAFSGFAGFTLNVKINDNELTSLDSTTFTGFVTGQYLLVFLHNNRITSLVQGLFAGTFGSSTTVSVFLRDNLITHVAPGLIEGFTGQFLNLALNRNQISALDPGVFAGVRGLTFALYLNRNIISQLSQALFSTFRGIELSIYLHHNLLTSLGEWVFGGNTGSKLTFSALNNNITVLGAHVFSGFNGNELVVDLTGNFIAALDPVVFGSGGGGGEFYGTFLQLTLNYNLITSLTPLLFSMFISPRLEVILENNIITHLAPGLISGFQGHHLVVNMNNNFVTSLESAIFDGYLGVDLYVYLDDNAITSLPSNVFSKFDGTGLAVYLNDNKISMLSTGFSFGLSSKLVASYLQGNSLQCAAYTPALVNCTCADTDTKFYQKCGYGVCSATSLACDAGTYPTQNCQYAPRSECIAVCPNVSEYMKVTSGDTPTAICFPISSCGTAFPYANQTGFYKAYQLANATQFDDTVCLRCTECAEGFVTTPCTATQDSSCTRTSDQLSSGQIAAIVLVSLAVAVAGVYLGWWGLQHKSGKEQTLRSYAEQTETLELTTKLLGVEEQKVADTELAWKVRWEDIELGDKLGAGAFGVVSKGQWLGSMVAVKVLNPAVMMFDVDSTAFEREVTAMRALHHPNLVTFYGFGTSANGKPFLVTELMFETLRQRLSWRKTSEDETGLGVDWGEARRWCADIVAGMLFLHTREPPMLHRDLKSDNCLLGENDLVKIADFGTVARPKDAGIPSVKHVEDDESLSGSLVMTASIFAGTPLWMAPEVMSGKHGWSHYGLPVDVYSFGMVMFEIATRLLPFPQCDKLSYFDFNDFVTDGGRPLIPTETLPRDYEQLMVRCWHANPNLRPVFTDVAHAITTMNVSLR
eukprot:m.229124 g.229124  ORF g.229124 m.229124 type:complete len:1047 (+) comp33553_c0_seq1:323-3463(+)